MHVHMYHIYIFAYTSRAHTSTHTHTHTHMCVCVCISVIHVLCITHHEHSASIPYFDDLGRVIDSTSHQATSYISWQVDGG